MRKLMLACACLAATLGSHAQDVIGPWNGTLHAGNTNVAMQLTFSVNENDEAECSLSVPEQGAQNIPAEVTRLTADSVYVNIKAIDAKFRGKADGTTIDGTFTQHGMDFPLTLQKGALAVNHSQTPKAPLPYATSEVTIDATDGVRLAGTLTYPTDYKQGDRPTVVLLVTGSGAQNRDEEIFGHKPFAVIADALAKAGIASLRCDDRGTGQSTGDAATLTTDNSASDAEAALAYLHSLGTFGKVGVIGHSEGGTIAFRLAAQGKADFIVSLAGMAVKGQECIVEQNRMLMTESGVSDAIVSNYCTTLNLVLDYKKTHATVERPDMALTAILMPNGLTVDESVKPNLIQILGSGDPALTSIINTDPTADLAAVKCPVMAVAGSKDLQVNADDNLNAIRKNVPSQYQSLIKKYDGLNHLFQHSSTGLPTEYGSLDETFSTDVLSDITTWINGLSN